MVKQVDTLQIKQQFKISPASFVPAKFFYKKFRVRNNNLKLIIFFISYFLLIILYSLFSYSLTAPNLVLSNNPTFWKFQTYMWDKYFLDRKLLTYTFTFLITLLFGNYFLILNFLKKKQLKTKINNIKFAFIAVLFFALPLLFSNNSLSYDVFNYIFNAKIVLHYKADPHVKVALDYARDDWTRFMHNTHTPAPYARGWTILSLLPYQIIYSIVGGHKFLSQWLGFRLFSILSIILLFFSINYLYKKIQNSKFIIYNFLILFFNPLFLIEIISNSHNDLWMMTPAVLSLALLVKSKKKHVLVKIIKLLASILLLTASIYIKLASAVLLPIWLYLFIKNVTIFKYILKFINSKLIISSASFVPAEFWRTKFRVRNKNSKLLNSHWPLLASMAMFVPLFTERSKYFLPWYLVWSMVWLPLIKNKLWKNLILVFSVSAMLRYVPFLWYGAYGESVLFKQKLITWLPGVIYLLIYCIYKLLKKYQTALHKS